MSSPSIPALQKLHHLDRSSPSFNAQLSDVLYGEEYKECILGLQRDDLVWLVDYLDKVRRCAALLHSPLKPAQALDDIDSSKAAFRKCLRELRTICGTGTILPTSYTLSSHLLSVSPDPVALGGYGDVHEGTLNGSRVCVKRMRVYAEHGSKEAAKVCH